MNTVHDVIRRYISEYEFRTDDGNGIVPSEAGKIMLEDFANGLIVEPDFYASFFIGYAKPTP